MATQNDPRTPASPTHAFLPADAHWIPRLMSEFEAPFAVPDARTADCMEQGARGVAALSSMALHPWTLLHTQWALLGLAAAHLGAMQRDWFDAWVRFLSGRTDEA